MEIAIVLKDTPTVADTFKVQRKIGHGNFRVYEIYSPNKDATYAVKIFPKNRFGIEQYQKELLMTNLKHQNIIQYIPTLDDDSQKFLTFLTEYAKFGNFLSIIKADLLSHEVLIRSYFHQLIDGLEYIHSQGIAHLDLKLENLMLGSDFLLKIIDFDQAQLIADKRVTSGGTDGFRAPELINKTGVNLTAIDIYSAGVILYTFLTKELPFLEIDDPECKDRRSYSYFSQYNKEFWNDKAQRFGNKGLFSDEFIELLNGILHCDPERRMKIQEIKNSKWYKGFVLDKESLKVAMQTKYKNLIQKSKN